LQAGVLGLLVLVLAAFAAAPPARPRNLTAQEQKEVDALQMRLNRHFAAGEFEQAARLAEQIAAFRAQRQGRRHWQSIDARFEAASWSRLAKVPQRNRPAVLRNRALTNEGLTLLYRGRSREAEKPLRQALAILLEVHGEQHPDTANGYNNLAYCLTAQGKPNEALSLHRRALAIRLVVLGEDHPDTATGCSLLAQCLDSRGNHAAALSLHQRALAIRRKVLGEQHPKTADGCSNLASCLDSQGKHREALAWHRRALDIDRAVFGDQHPATATTSHNLGLCLARQGKYGEALPRLQEALATLGRIHGQHPNTAICCDSVATCLGKQGKYEEALPLYRRALAIRLDFHGEQHPDIAISYGHLAQCLDSQGKHREALPLHQRALARFLDLVGEQHPHTGVFCNNMARCLESQGKYGEALSLYQKALAIYRKTHGEEHPETAISYTNLAVCLNRQGKHGEALPVFLRARAINLKVHGEQHPSTAACSSNLAQCLDLLGKHEEALRLHWHALPIFLKVHGERHPSTATCCDSLAQCLDRLGKHDEALRLYRRSLAICLAVHGELHPDTARTYSNLGHCLNTRGKHASALPLYKKALAIHVKVSGEQHPRTAHDCKNVALCLNRQGRAAEALRLLQTSLPEQEVARFHIASTGFERSFTSSTGHSHALLAAGLARLGQPRNAFRHAEFALARGLLDDLASSDPSERDRIANLAAELKSLGHRLVPLLGLDTLPREQLDLRDRLLLRRRNAEANLARLAAAVSARQVLPLEHIQRQVPADAALVLWVDDLGEHLGCVLRRAGPPAWVRLPGTGKAGQWTAEDQHRTAQAHLALFGPYLDEDERELWLRAAPRGGRAFFRQALNPARGKEILEAARRQRLDPLRPHLQGVRRLLVVPSGALSALPVEALTQDYTVSYVPSGSAFARAAEQPRTPRLTRALVLADPVFTRTPPKYPPAPPHGLLIQAVVNGGVAARFGLRPGDVLLEYAGKTLFVPDDLKPARGEDRVVIKLWRDGKTFAPRLPAGNLDVVLAKRPLRKALDAWRADERKLLAYDRAAAWAPLPGTRIEARSLASLLPGARLLLGSAASEQALEEMASSRELEGFGLLHLATHGEVNWIRPLDTALILAQDRLPQPKEQQTRVLAGKKPMEGRLTVDTILRHWRLDADLVVLSACQTGLGAATPGEGLLGFAHALLQKGARSVVLSRWKVDDNATALLMVRFYENLLGKRKGVKPMGRALALREAKAWLRGLSREQVRKRLARLVDGLPRGERSKVRPPLPPRKPGTAREDRPFAHPYYWAAFVLIGDPH
jgi:tetratricopeptide (TPR) repeat protein